MLVGTVHDRLHFGWRLGRTGMSHDGFGQGRHLSAVWPTLSADHSPERMMHFGQCMKA